MKETERRSGFTLIRSAGRGRTGRKWTEPRIIRSLYRLHYSMSGMEATGRVGFTGLIRNYTPQGGGLRVVWSGPVATNRGKDACNGCRLRRIGVYQVRPAAVSRSCTSFQPGAATLHKRRPASGTARIHFNGGLHGFRFGLCRQTRTLSGVIFLIYGGAVWMRRHL